MVIKSSEKNTNMAAKRQDQFNGNENKEKSIIETDRSRSKSKSKLENNKELD